MSRLIEIYVNLDDYLIIFFNFKRIIPLKGDQITRKSPRKLCDFSVLSSPAKGGHLR